MRPFSTMRTASNAVRSALEAVIVPPVGLGQQIYGVGGSRLGFDAHAERRLKALSRCNDSESVPARESVGGRGHRFDRDELLLVRRKDLRVGVARQQLDRDPTPPASQAKRWARIE